MRLPTDAHSRNKKKYEKLLPQVIQLKITQKGKKEVSLQKKDFSYHLNGFVLHAETINEIMSLFLIFSLSSSLCKFICKKYKKKMNKE